MTPSEKIFRRKTERAFPGLVGTVYAQTSVPTPIYNCIAFAAGENHRWWEPSPGQYWPAGAARTMDIAGLVDAFERVGFKACKNETLEVGYEKVVLYIDPAGEWTHAARLTLHGRWRSKLGDWEDIEHASPQELCGALYGNVHGYMKRKMP